MISWMSLDIKQLSALLFWDVARESVDWEHHKIWLLQRILDRGTWEDWLLVSRKLSACELRELAPRLKLQSRERTFVNNWIGRTDVH